MSYLLLKQTGNLLLKQGGALLLDNEQVDNEQVGGGTRKKWKYKPFWPAPLKADPAKKRRKREEEEILILSE